VAQSHPDSPDPYSWVFRFGLYGDPGKVTEAIEKIDGQLLSMASNWKVVPGTAKAIVTRTDGSEEAVELPSDMMSSDLSTTAYRLLDLVQTGGVKGDPTTESSTSELRQITSPDSEEYCSRHKKVGAEHTDEEVEDDLLNAKGEQETHMGVYPASPYNQVRHPGRQEDCPICMGDERSEGALNEEEGVTSEDLERQIEELSRQLGKPWTPGYQAVPKALKEGEPNIVEPEAPTDWGRIKKDTDTYGSEMVSLIETLTKIGEDPTVTPEAIEKSSKVAQDRVKDIVDWASDVADKVSEEDVLDVQEEAVMDGLQKIIEHGNRIEMLLIGTNEEAKQTAESPLPEPELPEPESL
jgi:hypothetical protein